MPKKRAKKRTTVADLDKKLDRVIATQKKILEKEAKIEFTEAALEDEEKHHLDELHELESFARKMQQDVGQHPLMRITYRDVAKGSVGAFFGVVAHYTFVYGVKVAHQIDITRAIITFFLAYLVGAVFLYFTGFRKVAVQRVAFFLPLRLTVLFSTAVLTSFLVLFLFQPDFLHSFQDAFKQLATVSLTATIGACTADLIGRE